MITPLDFSRALLLTMGLPVSENNVESLVGWIAQEGGHYNNGARYNPLNTSWNMPGTGSFGVAHIRIYNSWEQGLDATVKTLKNGLYKDILYALAKSSDPDETLSVISLNPSWGTHLYTPGSAKRWTASGMRLKDPVPNQGGGLSVLSSWGMALAKIKQHIPILGGVAILAGVGYYISKK